MPASAQRSIDEVLAELRDTRDLVHFVNMEIFELIPVLWNERHDAYARWKRRLASVLDVDPAGLVVVGSAALGVSLNPSKNFRPFQDDSDVDLAVVDARHFDVAWRHLRTMSRDQYNRLSVRSRASIDSHRKNYVFSGTIATDAILQVFPFAEQWLNATEEMRHVSPIDGRSLNVRLYRDYDALRAYQLESIQRARLRLLERR